MVSHAVLIRMGKRIHKSPRPSEEKSYRLGIRNQLLKRETQSEARSWSSYLTVKSSLLVKKNWQYQSRSLMTCDATTKGKRTLTSRRTQKQPQTPTSTTEYRPTSAIKHRQTTLSSDFDFTMYVLSSGSVLKVGSFCFVNSCSSLSIISRIFKSSLGSVFKFHHPNLSKQFNSIQQLNSKQKARFSFQV